MKGNGSSASARAFDGVRSIGDARRHALMVAAYENIAERGFEGLRTREVAKRAGVNIATLHYYFPCKGALISGVAEYLCRLFETVHGDAAFTGEATPLDRLHQEFADLRYYLFEKRDMLVVMHEFLHRSYRDPSVLPTMHQMELGWRVGLRQLMQDGMRTGIFRRDMEVEPATTSLMAFFTGLTSMSLTREEFDRACAALESWLTGKRAAARKRSRRLHGKNGHRRQRVLQPAGRKAHPESGRRSAP